jgi:hypothetical protein
VKEVIGNVQGKQAADAAGGSMPPRGISNTSRGYHGMQPANTNLQLLYYEAGGVSYGTLPDMHSPGLPQAPHVLGTDRVAIGEVSEGVREQITRTLRELGFTLKVRTKAYQKPYTKNFDSLPYPQGFSVLDFIKFTGDDSRTTYEHIG